MNLARNGGIAIDLDSGLLVRASGGSGGSGGSGSAGAVTFYTCVSVDASSKTWSGQRWEWQETGYVKLDAVTEGLTFGDRFTPVAGQVYNAEATVRATILCHKQGVVPEGAVFHASLCALMETAESGQALTVKEGPAPEETVEDGIPCLKFSGGTVLAFPYSGLPTGKTPFTVSVWAKMDAGSAAAHVFGYGNLGAEGGGCTIHLSSGRVTDVGGCGYDHGCDLPSGKSAMAWHHYAIRWDGTYSRIYVDGALLSTMDRSGRNMSQYNGAIGGSHSWGDRFSGYIAAARIYDTALDDGGILSLAGEFNPLSAG